MKSFDVLLKTPWFSSPCEWFRFAFQRGLKSFKMTPWSQLPPKVHLRTKVKYWKPLSIFQKLRVTDLRLSDSVDSRSDRWVTINDQCKSTDIDQKFMKTYESMNIKENRRNSWPPNSLSFCLASHPTCREQLEYSCKHMSRKNVCSGMWWFQPRSSRPVAYVVGGRVGMDESHQVKIHFNWDNLSVSIPIPY